MNRIKAICNKILKFMGLKVDDQIQKNSNRELLLIDNLSLSKINKIERSLKQKDITSELETKLEHFSILNLLGEGACSKVFLVENSKTKMLYAMKVISKEKVRRLNQIHHVESERNILTSTNDSSIVKLFYSFQTEDNFFLILEFMQGGDLLFHLENKTGIFNKNVILQYSAELVNALEYLHNQGIIYRDMKPENLLIGSDGHLKIADFGLSKKFDLPFSISNINLSKCISEMDTFNPIIALNYDKEKLYSYNNLDMNINTEMLRTNSIVGTKQYAAPEIFHGKSYDYLVDYWGLGMIIFQMVTGEMPKFNSTGLILEDTNGELIDQDENLCKLIIGLLDFNPSTRLGSKDNLRNHPYFSSINWDEVGQGKSEFIPIFKEKRDMKFFDPKYTNRSISYYDMNYGKVHFIQNPIAPKRKTTHVHIENFDYNYVKNLQ